MSKYNVGDVIKLRDDLDIGEEYGDVAFLSAMKTLQHKALQIDNIDVDRDGRKAYCIKGWYISDEMIEGLWEECKEKQNKLKLIDVLNMIAKGELKEGTKVICNNSTFEYRKLHKDSGRNTLDLYSKNNTSLINATYLTPVLSFEVELIEPPCVGADKTIEPTKIEELEISDRYYTVQEIIGKLNEVIRKINKEE